MVGVDGAGRTYRLRQLAAATTTPVCWLSGAPADVTASLAAARAEGRLVIVDDAHRLDTATLRELSAAARSGVPMVISRRPTIDRSELSELDEAVAAGGVEFLGPLDRDGVARLVATVTGRPVSPDTAAAVFEASAGLAAVAAAVAVAPPDAPVPALLARVQRRFAVLDHTVVTAARVLALRLDLADHVLAAAAGIDVAELAAALRSLRDEGLLVPDGERMIPAVAAAVLGELPAAERRRIHDAVAGALIAAGTDPVAAAGQLRAARAGTPVAAAVYREAGERLRFSDPAAALSWYDDAADAGGDPATVAAGRAETGALLGLPVDVDPFAAGLSGRWARRRRSDHPGRRCGRRPRGLDRTRAAEVLLGAAGPGPVLAVPALVGLGRVAEARAAARGPAPAALLRFAEGALAAGDPACRAALADRGCRGGRAQCAGGRAAGHSACARCRGRGRGGRCRVRGASAHPRVRGPGRRTGGRGAAPAAAGLGEDANRPLRHRPARTAAPGRRGAGGPRAAPAGRAGRRHRPATR